MTRKQGNFESALQSNSWTPPAISSSVFARSSWQTAGKAHKHVMAAPNRARRIVGSMHILIPGNISSLSGYEPQGCPSDQDLITILQLLGSRHWATTHAEHPFGQRSMAPYFRVALHKVSAILANHRCMPCGNRRIRNPDLYVRTISGLSQRLTLAADHVSVTFLQLPLFPFAEFPHRTSVSALNKLAHAFP